MCNVLQPQLRSPRLGQTPTTSLHHRRASSHSSPRPTARLTPAPPRSQVLHPSRRRRTAPARRRPHETPSTQRRPLASQLAHAHLLTTVTLALYVASRAQARATRPIPRQAPTPQHAQPQQQQRLPVRHPAHNRMMIPSPTGPTRPTKRRLWKAKREPTLLHRQPQPLRPRTRLHSRLAQTHLVHGLSLMRDQ